MKDKCGCCEGTEVLVPAVIGNRPGLHALHYRIGTHGSFLETMKARLSSSQYPVLQKLTTREGKDTSIALLDAWSTVANVLTFYQERIANEGYLRTATERRSILELARLIGYRLRPGVAASVFLAFTIEDGFDAEIPRGTRANSMAGQGESSQPFETSEPLKARSVWNTLKPRLTQPQFFTSDSINDDTLIYLDGTTTNLKPNSPLLIDFSTRFLFRIDDFVDDLITELDGGAGLDVMLNEFMNNGYELSDSAIVIIGVTGKEWTIVDSSTKYFVQVDTQDEISVLNVFYATDEVKSRLYRTLYRTLDVAVNQEAERTAIMMMTWKPPSESNLRSTPKVIKEVVENIITHYEELKEFGLSTTKGVAAKKVLPILTEAKEKVSLVTDDLDAQVLEILSETIGKLQDIFETVDVRTRRLREWLSNLLAELEKVQEAQTIVVQVQEKIAQASSNPEKLEILTEAISQLKEIRDTLDIKMQPLQEWLSSLIIGYERNAQEYTPQPAAAMLAVRPGLAPSPIIGNLPFNGMKFGQLTRISLPPIVVKPPAVPPPSPLQLPRDSGQIFATRSDMISRMLFTLNAAFAAPVYMVMARSTVPEATPTIGTEILKSIEALRVTAALFGHDAPPQPERDTDQNIIAYIEPTLESSWGGLVPSTGDLRVIVLDKEYDQIKPGSSIVIDRYLNTNLEAPRQLLHCQVDQVETRSLGIVGTAISATVLTLTNIVEENNTGTALNGWISLENLSDQDSTLVLRNTRVYAQTEPLSLAELPIVDPIEGDVIELAELYDGLEPGRWLIISGERVDIQDEFGNVINGIMASERVLLDQVIQDVQHVDDETDLPGDHPHTFLQISPSLAYKYKPETVRIYANVVKATHGETLSESFGSGDGSQVFQTFELRQTPLTYVAAPTPDGIENSLVVRANDVQWLEAKSIADLGPKDRGYVTRIDDDGKTSIIFGNGKHGARPPTGVENIKGKYRRGIGKAGNARAEQIKLLATKPLHVKSVINPLRASGGADPESRDQARKNAPLVVTGFDRLVSVKDYEDFARRFAGIGKASAVSLSDGRRGIVHLTIAGADDIPIDEGSDLFLNLRRALQKFGDSYQPVVVALRALSLLVIRARVQLLADYAWEFVEPKIRAAVLEAFSFERRELGQDVTSSEVVSVIQSVEGVSYVDLETLDAVDDQRLKSFLEQNGEQTDQNGGGALVQRLNLTLKLRLSPDLARLDPQTQRVLPAQIAYLDPTLPDTLILTELQA